MFRNSHFALATHALIVLSIKTERPTTSSELATSVGTNPAFLRTLLGRLKKAGLVELKLGKGGGASLAVPAKNITLLEVYNAVNDEPAMTLHRCEPDAECLVGRNIVPVLEVLMRDIETAVESELAARTVADLARSVRRRG